MKFTYLPIINYNKFKFFKITKWLINKMVEMICELYPRSIVTQHVLHVNHLGVFVVLDRLDVNEHFFLPI